MAENSITIRLGVHGLAQVQQGLKRFLGGVEKDSRGLAAGGLSSLSSGLLKVTAAIGGLVATYASLRGFTRGLKDMADYGTFWGDRPTIRQLLDMLRTGTCDFTSPRRLKVSATR